MRRLWFALLVCLAAISQFSIQPLLAQEQLPDSQGAIVVTVQPGEGLWTIAANAGLTLEELLDLNNLTRDAIVHPGQQLIVGMAAPPETPESAAIVPVEATPTAEPPPPTAALNAGTICLTAFEDLNHSGSREAEERILANVNFVVRQGDFVVKHVTTDGSTEAYCLDRQEAGVYEVQRILAPSEEATTPPSWLVSLGGGNKVSLEVGSVEKRIAETSAPEAPVLDSQPAWNVFEWIVVVFVILGTIFLVFAPDGVLQPRLRKY